MTTSVAMCTYNGALFVREQLQSILSQNKPVDEIIICDDCSTDDTTNIIECVQQETSIKILLFKNNHQLGVNANFEQAIKRCSGDIIFLSDQDDIWEKNKVETILGYFETHPNKNVVFGDAWLVDSNGDFILRDGRKIRLWQVVGFSKKAQKQFDKGFELELWDRMNRATGATMAFRRNFGQSISYSTNLGILHDWLLAIKAFDNGHSLGYIIPPLILYRQHSQNVVGCNMDLMNEQYWDDARYPVQRCWIDYSKILQNARYIQERTKFQTKRYGFMWSFGGYAVLKNTIYYFRYYGVYGSLFWAFDYKRSLCHSLKRIKRKLHF